MTGELYIDGIDAYLAFGITAVGYNALVSYPPLKAVTIIDYPDENGIRVDLNSPKLDARTFDMTVYVDSIQDLSSLQNYILNGREHTWNFYKIGLTKTLYVKKIGNPRKTGYFFIVSITLVDNYPLENYSYSMPNLTSQTRDLNFKLDNVKFARYGIVPLQGTEAQLLLPESPKSRLTITNSTMSGQDYDDSTSYLAARDVTIYLFIYKKKADFWAGYNAFLYNLTTPGAKSLQYTTRSTDVGTISATKNCYYKSGRVTDIAVTDYNTKIWCKFEVTLCLINR